MGLGTSRPLHNHSFGVGELLFPGFDLMKVCNSGSPRMPH